jgi:hypothetical protein
MRSYLLIFILLLISTPVVHAQDPVPAFESRYSLYIFNTKIGESMRRLTRQADGRWHFESESGLVGVAAMLRKDRIHESSIWRWENGHIVPQRYTYRQDGSKKNRNIDIRFDWKAGLARSDYRGEKSELPLTQDVLDHSVYQVQLMYDMARKYADKPPPSITYTIINGKKTKPYRIDFVGEETLDTPLGKIQALKFSHRDDDKRNSALWLAPALAYLPVRAQHTEKGETVDMRIDSVSGIRLSAQD